MSSPQRRRANRANALRSTGPRSPAGKRAASLNATRHGLSAPTDPNVLGPEALGVAELIALEGIAPDRARELTALVIDFERNLALQRELIRPTPVTQVVQDEERMHREVPELDMLDDALDWERFTRGRVPIRMLRGHAKLALHLQDSWLKLQPRPATADPAACNRYLRRSTNQLIKALRSLGGV